MDMKLFGVNACLALTVTGLLATAFFLREGSGSWSGLLFYVFALVSALFTFDMAKMAWQIATGRRKYREIE